MTRRGGRKRVVENESYFTTDLLARECVAFLERLVPLDHFSYVLEPSAGAGAFLRALEPRRVHAIDIMPADPRVEACDFFHFEPPLGEPRVLVIGNPPFGQRGALAMRFLDRATAFAETVAFILPRSFKKHTFVNRVDERFHLLGQFDCQDFVRPDGSRVEVKCVFQVWTRQPVQRARLELPSTHEDFEMKHFHLSRTAPAALAAAVRHFDFAIAQVGANFTPRSLHEVRAGSHWFIKVRHAQAPEIFKRLNFDFLDGLNTAHKSLSKRDIIRAYEEARAALQADCA